MKCAPWVCVLLLSVASSAYHVRAEEDTTDTFPIAGTASNTVITSDTLMIDYQRDLAVFDGNVDVDHGDVKMTSDHMIVALGAEKTISSITCRGNVQIWQRDRYATADRAIYIERTGQVNLIGNATVKQGQSSLSGTRITFWRNEDRLECEPGRLVIFPGEFGEESAADAGTGTADDALDAMVEPEDAMAAPPIR